MSDRDYTPKLAARMVDLAGGPQLHELPHFGQVCIESPETFLLVIYSFVYSSR